MKYSLPRISHDYASFETLAQLHAQTKELFLDVIDIDLRTTDWFDADMCAAFGAILYSLGDRLNKVNIIHIPKKVETILSKNGFLSHYGGAEIPDLWGTTIPYQQFDVPISYQRFDDRDDDYFVSHVENEFIHHPELPKMSPQLFKIFRKSIGEIFGNAVFHSQTELGIFSCGQFFPTKNLLYFTVVDLGVGICQNIKEHTELEFSPEDAITWATKEHTTTRLPISPDMPGGLGLPLLCDFIDLNGGCIRIVSDAGYWQRKKSKIKTTQLNYPFPGTVVSLEINTADTGIYRLSHEDVDPEYIF